MGWGYVQTAITTASRKLLGSRKRTATLRLYGGNSQSYIAAGLVDKKLGEEIKLAGPLTNAGFLVGDHVQLKVDVAKKTITITEKIPKQTGTS